MTLSRLHPRVLRYLLHNRVRRAWITLVSRLAGRPSLLPLLRRFLLIDEVSLRAVGGDSRHGVSELVEEDTPTAKHFSSARYGRLISQAKELFEHDPYGLAGYPESDPAKVFDGGLTLVGQPDPGMVYVPPRRFHCVLREPWLHLGQGGLCTTAGAMVKEYVPRSRQGNRMQRAWVYGRFRPRRAQRLEGRYATVYVRWARTNYYHWLIDCLPRLQRLAELDRLQPLTLLLPHDLPPAWEESLACCLPPDMAVKRADGWVRPEQLVFASWGWIQSAAWLSTAEREFVRHAVYSRYGLQDAAPGRRRIYLSRATARLRQLENEEEVRAILTDFDFETVRLEELDFEQQVRLFHGASHVVGVHGAGFANLLFAGRPHVLELFAADRFKPLYFFLARSLGQHHDFLLGNAGNRVEDFRVDAKRLRDAVDALVAPTRDI